MSERLEDPTAIVWLVWMVSCKTHTPGKQSSARGVYGGGWSKRYARQGISAVGLDKLQKLGISRIAQFQRASGCVIFDLDGLYNLLILSARHVTKNLKIKE